jgi:hypothetical protein
MSKTIECLLSVDESLIEEMRKLMGSEDATVADIMTDALTVFRWLLVQACYRRAVIAADPKTFGLLYRLAFEPMEEIYKGLGVKFAKHEVSIPEKE